MCYLQKAEEGQVQSILGVHVHSLLDGVRALKHLDARVERPALGLEEHLYTVDQRAERVPVDSVAVYRRERGRAFHGRLVERLRGDVGGEREFERGHVADDDRAGGGRRREHGAERAKPSVLDKDAHLQWAVVGTLPEVDGSVYRSTVGFEEDTRLVHGVSVIPCAHGSTLHSDGRVRLGGSARLTV